MQSNPSKEEIDDFKAQGNGFFIANNYRDAEEMYSKAIELDSTQHVLYGNRSTARLHMGRAQEALEDAESAIRLCPTWSKGYYRQGAAYAKLQEYRKAQIAYSLALKYDPKAKTVPDLVRQMKQLADQHDKTVNVADRDHWKTIYENITDVRVRLSTLVFFWNQSTSKERLAVFRRFLQVLGAMDEQAQEFSEREMLQLPANNYEDIELQASWLEYYTSLNLTERVQTFEDMYELSTEQEKTMIVNDMKSFLLNPLPQHKQEEHAR